MRRIGRVALAGLGLAALMAAPAQGDEAQTMVRVGGAFMEPNGELDERLQLSDPFVGEIQMEPDAAASPVIGYERRLSPRFGLEASVYYFEFDVDTRTRVRDTFLEEETIEQFGGELSMIPITLGLNYHLTPNLGFDLYVGLMVVYTVFDDIALEQYVRGLADDIVRDVATSNDLGWGAVLGVNKAVGESDKWVIFGSFRHLRASAEVDEDGADNAPLDIDPYMAELGVGYRF
jgi:outer membrane protein W